MALKKPGGKRIAGFHVCLAAMEVGAEGERATGIEPEAPFRLTFMGGSA